VIAIVFVMGILKGEFNYGHCDEEQGLQDADGMLAKLWLRFPDPTQLVG
jgi:hypothetical protein